MKIYLLSICTLLFFASCEFSQQPEGKSGEKSSSAAVDGEIPNQNDAPPSGEGNSEKEDLEGADEIAFLMGEFDLDELASAVNSDEDSDDKDHNCSKGKKNNPPAERQALREKPKNDNQPAPRMGRGRSFFARIAKLDPDQLEDFLEKLEERLEKAETCAKNNQTAQECFPDFNEKVDANKNLSEERKEKLKEWFSRLELDKLISDFNSLINFVERKLEE